MAYRLALDLGTNSIGWAQFALDNQGQITGLRDGGVHIFDQGRKPKELTSKAADRRAARGMRRNRDRKNLRKVDLIKTLMRHGLMPDALADRQALETLDPYELRARGLKEKLTAHEFGRALFHLHQRRGFKSNRKSAGGDETKKIPTAIRALQAQLQKHGHETYGQFLAHRRAHRLPTRLRLQGEGAKALYDFYPTREMIRAEFNLLFDRQRQFGFVEANAQAQHALEEGVLFRQRKLKPPLVGKCKFIPDEDRASKAMPTAQRFRIWQETLNLRIRNARQEERELTHQEQDTVVQALLKSAKVTFDSLKKKLKLSEGTQFNLESDRRKALKGDETGAEFRKNLKETTSPAWDSFSLAQQDAITALILGQEDDEQVVAKLKTNFGLDEAGAQALATCNPSPRRGHLSLQAMSQILQVFEARRLSYADAVPAAGLGHHSNRTTGEIWEALPYYGEVLANAVSPTIEREKVKNPEDIHGRFPNPTVHIVLNRLRKLVNALIDRDGKPAEIVVESGRELPLSADGRGKLKKLQTDNTKENDRRAEIIRRHGVQVNADTLLRLALWEELAPDYLCVFSGEKISEGDLFNGKAEIEHILPYSRTLDDSRSNKTMAVLRINREKRNRSPYEAFGENSAYDYEDILIRVRESRLPPNKARRFAKNAMEKYTDENKWLDRQLTDNQYVARLAVQYLTPICTTYDGHNKPVWSVPGALTGRIRKVLGLDDILGKEGIKNRDDHRHHFVDACVLGVVERGMLQQISHSAKRSFDGQEQKLKISKIIADTLGPLSQTLRQQAAARAATLSIAHRPDHSKGGKLLEETAYGFVNKSNPATAYDPKDQDAPNVTQRVDLNGDKFKSVEDVGKKIMSAKTIAKLQALLVPALEVGVPFKEAMEEASQKLGIKKVRIGLRETVEPISVNGQVIKGYASGGNWAYDFYDCPYDGFGAELINLRAANRRGFVPEWIQKHPEARRLMRLFSGDMIEIDDPREGKSGRAIFRIQKLSKQITLCEPKEANAAARNKDEKLFYAPTPRTLIKLGIRKLHVSVLGKVRGRASAP